MLADYQQLTEASSGDLIDIGSANAGVVVGITGWRVWSASAGTLILLQSVPSQPSATLTSFRIEADVPSEIVTAFTGTIENRILQYRWSADDDTSPLHGWLRYRYVTLGPLGALPG